MRSDVGCGRREPRARRRELGVTRREVGGTWSEVKAWRRGAGVWRREAGDVAQGAPQRALCDVWRRKVRIRNQESGGRKYESGGGT